MDKLLFIHKARSGKANAFFDVVHKILQLSSDACELYRLTYGRFSKRKEWKQFRSNSSIPMEFLHKDEFVKNYASKFGYRFSFPVVLAVEKGELQMLISAEELAAMSKIDDLITTLEGLI